MTEKEIILKYNLAPWDKHLKIKVRMYKIIDHLSKAV